MNSRLHRLLWLYPPWLARQRKGERVECEARWFATRTNVDDPYPVPMGHAVVEYGTHEATISSRHPAIVAQYALGCWERALREQFMQAAKALLRLVRFDNRREMGALPYLEDFEYMRAPWISAMYQGEAVSVFVRAHGLWPEGPFSDAAGAAAATMFAPMENGRGCAVFHGDGSLSLEEYPTIRPSTVLNGFLFALFGVADLLKRDMPCRVQAREVWERSLAFLERHLDDYDSGYWSYYDHPSFGYSGLVPPKYHIVHIAQLKAMGLLSGRTVFKQKAAKFLQYLNNEQCQRRALVGWVWKGIVRNCYYRISRTHCGIRLAETFYCGASLNDVEGAKRGGKHA